MAYESWLDTNTLQDPDALMHVLKAKLLWFIAAAAVLFIAYVAVDMFGRRSRAGAKA